MLASLTDEGCRIGAEGEAEVGGQVLALTGHLTPAACAGRAPAIRGTGPMRGYDAPVPFARAE
ncbi:hypothetical protein ACQP2P_24305 [Dactylosporangium sp. CA-139114]|uniref:hypothetical protein n=1 Tax=Dactylosporangium sp. CA-139114 TaxID=3239931 RepID=UPI003D979728